jgi:hypothetical protein
MRAGNTGSAAGGSAAKAQLRRRLQESGLSLRGIDQVLAGHVVTSPQDRERLAGLLAQALGPAAAGDGRVYGWNKTQELRSGR